MQDRARITALLARARDGGARAAEALRVETQLLEQVSARRPAVSRVELRWTVRVWGEGGRAGTGAAEDPDAALAQAFVAMKAAAPSAVAGPADRYAIRAGGNGIDDPRFPGVTDADRADILVSAERAMQAAPVRRRGVRLRQGRSRRAWMSTRGVEAEEHGTCFEIFAEADLGDVELDQRLASRHFADVASLPFGPELRRRLDLHARPGPLPAAPLPWVLEPRAVGGLLMSLGEAFVGDGRTFVDDLPDGRLAPSIVHVTDDPARFAGLHTCAFDDRGVPPIAVTLVREGLAHGRYHAPEDARDAGLRPTGHFRDGCLRPANPALRPGSRTRNMILAELGEHVSIERLPAVDRRTGLVSGVALGVLVRGGERVSGVRVPLSEHVTTLLARATEVAGDQERVNAADASSLVLAPAR